MATTSSGTESATLTQNRLVMSASSVPSNSSNEGATGSSVIPHFGQTPGPGWRTSGCIGQV